MCVFFDCFSDPVCTWLPSHGGVGSLQNFIAISACDFEVAPCSDKDAELQLKASESKSFHYLDKDDEAKQKLVVIHAQPGDVLLIRGGLAHAVPATSPGGNCPRIVAYAWFGPETPNDHMFFRVVVLLSMSLFLTVNCRCLLVSFTCNQ
jgi:hypothetical protein